MGKQLAMIETGVVPDTFVSGLGEVEPLGDGLFRFSFYAMERGELVVVAKLVAPRQAVTGAVKMAAQAIGTCACEALRDVMMH